LGLPMTPPEEPTTKPKRGPKVRFLPGNREGPGRPKCARKTTLLVEELLDNEAEALTRTLIVGTARCGPIPTQQRRRLSERLAVQRQ
jgi:hypothetical protein